MEAAAFSARILGLSPFGPIFGKELRTTARRRRSYLLRVAYLGGLLLSLLAAWASSGSRYASNSISAQVQAQAKLGTEFFVSFAMFSVFAMAAIGPVLTSTAVGSERLAKTLPVLLMTPINAWQIVAGKLFSRLLVALTLLGLSLPVLALVRLLGGVELWQMAGIVCVCAVTALVAASIGLLYSVLINRAYAVILLSYATIFFLYALVPFMLVEGLGNRSMAWLRFFTWTNPFVCAAMVSEPRGFLYAGTEWTVCVTVHLGFTAALLALSALLLRRATRREGERAVSVAPEETRAPEPACEAASGDDKQNRAARGFAPRGSNDRRLATQPFANRDVWDHPVLWREMRRSLMARRWQSMIAGAATVGLLFLTYALLAAQEDLSRQFTQQAYACVFNGMFWLLTAVLAATAIAQEKESDTWTLLLATPLSGHAVVWGKVAGLCRRAAWPFAVFAGHFLLFGAARVIEFRGALLSLWVIASFNSIWVATGIYLSLRLRKVTLAVIVNLLLAVTIYLVAFFVLLVVGDLSTSDDLADHVAWYLPYYYLSRAVVEAWPHWQNGILRMPGGVRVGREQFTIIVIGVGAAHLLLSGLILAATAAAFDGIVGRARQVVAGAPPKPGRLAPAG